MKNAIQIKCSNLFLLIILSSLLLIYPGCSGSPSVYKQSVLSQLDLQGHRGARGLRPENTWPAFTEAIKYGMHTLELDTVLTKDNRIIVHHDSATNPVICVNDDGTEIQSRSLYDLTLAELQALDCGSNPNPDFPEQQTVPKTRLLEISEFFIKINQLSNQNKPVPPLRFNIETKFPENENSQVSPKRMQQHVDMLLAEIKKAGVMNRTTVQSFYMPALSYLRQKNKNISSSALFAPSYSQGFVMLLGIGDGYRDEILQKAMAVQANIISPYSLYITKDFVQQAHRNQLKVIPWTVNTKKEMQRMIQCEVDGIISDYPNRLRELVDDLKQSNSVR